MKTIEDFRFLAVTISVILAGAILYFILAPKPEVILREDINRSPEKYQKIVQEVIKHKNQLPLGELIANQNIPASLKEEIEEVDINLNLTYLTIDNAFNCDQLNITLIYGKYQVDYTPCPDKVQLQQSAYYKNGFIEAWKINENWSIMLDSDFI